MPDINSFGGECPNCKSSMIMKYTEKTDELKFDACPQCGLIKAKINNEELSSENKKILWDDILFMHDVESFSDLSLVMMTKETDDEGMNRIWPSVFDYSDTDEDSLKSLILIP